ncbi:type I glyceraldehyde-3-phosphate dehydrogenase [Desulfofundulus sp. TPOSR]|uniref:Glyceraldehyde-3-phosphate dehydrogenase n=1 Tax=Desulfofundulus kuznetsovii (strain DSM 6115 / VKM B-1805 / 17) TaxID=760568 RepID=A0AAU8PWH9_DESK7|nr:type I glyceraldehyde-3-phosphate dehydrogenase [Desulfofundulus sp. TPOSR]AEG16781.1 glyceraldehyde-3-phosphate dehydrogenase, type I [Desulfofundulus kuznetsovii DSM 6115]NHM28818.1 type I glyceraldehyde-3-phosphate dehydrogenase [Desulfofundulus sp. TPOSR]
MTVKIGINGFGRIGRNVLRASLRYPEIQVVAVNHKSRRLPANGNYVRTLAHALKYDSVHGRLDADVQADERSLVVNDREIAVFAEADPASIPWGKLGVDVVVESTGKFRTAEDAAVHLSSGAKKVIISAPAKGDVLTVVMGVNEELYNPAVHHVISNASCTTNCLAPVAKVLDEQFGIVKGLMTTVHAYTNDQQILDMPHRDLRRGRAAGMSIIPTTTGAARAVELVLPQLKGKLNGMAMRVPTPNVSVVDFVAQLRRPVTAEEVNGALKDASEGGLKGILAYSDLPLVSVDYCGDPHSAIVDGPSTMVIGEDMVKVVAWYDNEWGYSNRILDLILYMARRGF